MGIKNDCRRNAEGYSDPTAYEALKNMEQEEERFHKLLDTIFALCELSDFHIEERIVIKDKRTDEFGGDYLCVMELEKQSVLDVSIEKFVFIRTNISGI